MSAYITATLNHEEIFTDIQTGIADEIYEFHREHMGREPGYGQVGLDPEAFARFLAGRHTAILDICGEPDFDKSDTLYFQAGLVLVPENGDQKPEETVDAFNTASTLFGIPVKDVTEFTVEIS